ncbi:MAG: dihydrofolate reductase [Pseudomonadota bacterium]
MITLIVARALNGAIGKGNTIPWHAPEDLAFFQRETRGGAVIMGRNTWDSLPFKPLKNRMNIVVSSQQPDAEHVVPSIEAAIELARAAGHARLYGIGGAGIYRAMLETADRLLVTEVDLEVPDADVFFPAVDPANWSLVHRHTLRCEAPACELTEYLRRA